VKYHAEGCKALAWGKAVTDEPLWALDSTPMSIYVLYICTAHGIKIETGKYKKVIKNKNHEEFAAGRQM
jgi:hypothetical protein